MAEFSIQMNSPRLLLTGVQDFMGKSEYVIFRFSVNGNQFRHKNAKNVH